MTRLPLHSLHAGNDVSVIPCPPPTPPQERDLWQHISVGLAGLSQKSVTFSAWTSWKFFWNKITKQNIYWQNYWYNINIQLCLFYILIFNGQQVLMCFMAFIKSCTLSTIWSRTAKKYVFFFLIFYLILHIKPLGGKSIFPPVYMVRINSSKLLYRESKYCRYVRPA